MQLATVSFKVGCCSAAPPDPPARLVTSPKTPSAQPTSFSAAIIVQTPALTWTISTKSADYLKACAFEVIADPKIYQFTFKLGGQIISTSDADNEAIFNQYLKEFEQQHPDTNIEDLLDINKQLTEDTPFAEIVNQVKGNLVTIEQTWGCLPFHAYAEASCG